VADSVARLGVSSISHSGETKTAETAETAEKMNLGVLSVLGG
jgi:hypothetical protein